MPLIRGSLTKATMLRRDYEEEYEEGTTWPEYDQQVPQHEGSTAYLQPILEYSCGNPSAYLTTPEEKTLTPILDTELLIVCSPLLT
eukprot:5885156-Amphidinium_carterae.2